MDILNKFTWDELLEKGDILWKSGYFVAKWGILNENVGFLEDKQGTCHYYFDVLWSEMLARYFVIVVMFNHDLLWFRLEAIWKWN